MKRKIQVRPYKRRSGSKVKGHNKNNPQFTIKTKSKKRNKAIERLAESGVKYLVPPVKVIKDFKDTVDDLKKVF